MIIICWSNFYSQNVTQDDKGNSIVLYKDGTWKFVTIVESPNGKRALMDDGTYELLNDYIEFEQDLEPEKGTISRKIVNRKIRGVIDGIQNQKGTKMVFLICIGRDGEIKSAEYDEHNTTAIMTSYQSKRALKEVYSYK